MNANILTIAFSLHDIAKESKDLDSKMKSLGNPIHKSLFAIYGNI